MKTANDLLMGSGGAKHFKFDAPGAEIEGRIVAISEPYQEREYDQANPGGGAPKFYPKSGDPIMSFYVDLQTSLREDADDDGVRRVYMDGARPKKALRAAVMAAGASGIEVGGHLKVSYVSDQVPGDNRSGKNYVDTYTPGNAASSVLMGQQPAQAPAAPAAPASAPASAQAAPQQQAPAAPQVQWTDEQIAAARAAGVQLPGM